MTISVDPRYIALGSKVLIQFQDPEYAKYNGVYTARDIGGGIKGHHIDLFMGDFNSNQPSKITTNFGVVKARVIVLNNIKR